MTLFPQMLEMLHKSVADIVASAPENRDQLLATSFAEFEAAVTPELEKFASSAAEMALEKMANEITDGVGRANSGEEPLFKGLGCVGRVANLVSRIATMVDEIIDPETDDTDPDDDGDPASEEVSALLEHLVEVAEIALRSSVNEHVGVADPDEEAEDGMQYIHVPNAEDPNNEGAALVLKTMLPQELAKFASDPASISMASIQLGSALLLDAGVSERALSKAFEVFEHPLAKDASAGANAGSGPGDPNASIETDPSAGDSEEDPTDVTAQVEVLGRIAAAMLMQVDHVMQLLGSDGSDQTDDTAPAADPAMSADAGSEMPAGANPNAPPAKMAKSDDAEMMKLRSELATVSERMEKMTVANPGEMAALREQVARLSAQPAAPKAPLGGALTKQAETAGTTGDVLEKLAAEYDAARSDDERTRVMLKGAIKGVDMSSLRKLD